jgi:hypothetical protein
VSISAALSIPFIAVAFQLERMSYWVKKVPWIKVLIWAGALAVVLVPLTLLWTSHLASGIKTAVTIALALTAALGGAGCVIYKLKVAGRDTRSASNHDDSDATHTHRHSYASD